MADERIMNVAKKVCNGNFLPCLRCGEMDVAISLDLSNTHGEEAFQCLNCEERFSLDDVRTILAKWPKIVAWIESLPDVSED